MPAHLMPDRLLPAFDDADALATLEALDDTELDALDFGVVGFDAATRVVRCNAFATRLAGVAPERVLGRPFFGALAPCLDNFLVAERFEDAAVCGLALDATLEHAVTLRMRPAVVRLRLLARPRAARRYLVVTRQR